MLGSRNQAVFFYIYIYIINRPSGLNGGQRPVWGWPRAQGGQTVVGPEPMGPSLSQRGQNRTGGTETRFGEKKCRILSDITRRKSPEIFRKKPVIIGKA